MSHWCISQVSSSCRKYQHSNFVVWLKSKCTQYYQLTWSILFHRFHSSPQSTPFSRRAISFGIIMKMVETVSPIGAATPVRAVRVAATVSKLGSKWFLQSVRITRTRSLLVHYWFRFIHSKLASQTNLSYFSVYGTANQSASDTSLRRGEKAFSM